MKSKRNITIYILILVAIVFLARFFITSNDEAKSEEVNFTKMMEMIKAKKVKSIEIEDMKVTVQPKEGDTEIFTYAPDIIALDYLGTKYIYPLADEGELKVDSVQPKGQNIILTMLPTLLTAAFLIFFIFFIMSGAGMGGGGKINSFGRSRARMQPQDKDNQIKFADVAGLDEEKVELMEVVDFLKAPKKYEDLGARIPKGLLLVGPPGTGKTYISRATAGEAEVPFFTMSGSDFVEMFVGVGASRVRDLFSEAKKKSPCIIFIDELDAVGRRRGAGLGGGHDEREQTLNQLLVEMDGFGQNSGIIMLAATNRPDILDPALLRPGRFDRQVVIGLPDIKAREEVFKVHSKNKKLEKAVSPKILARRTPGFSPADIENMLNEAALLTARRNGREIRMEEIEEAITKVIAGPQKKSRVIPPEERKLTAYHEAGHAIIAQTLETLDPVHQVTIIPRGLAGGFTMTLPKEDSYYVTKKHLQEEIVELLGGRIAEKIALDDISSGASNDIMRATELAKDMVTKYGFSPKLGPVNYSDAEEVFLGKDFSTRKNYSEETASEIDAEVKSIIESAFAQGETIIKKYRKTLDTIADALLELETLDAEQFDALYAKKTTLKKLIANHKHIESKKKTKNAHEAKLTKKALARAKKKQEEEEKNGGEKNGKQT